MPHRQALVDQVLQVAQRAPERYLGAVWVVLEPLKRSNEILNRKRIGFLRIDRQRGSTWWKVLGRW